MTAEPEMSLRFFFLIINWIQNFTTFIESYLQPANPFRLNDKLVGADLTERQKSNKMIFFLEMKWRSVANVIKLFTAVSYDFSK